MGVSLALTLLPVMFTVTPAAVLVLPAALWAKLACEYCPVVVTEAPVEEVGFNVTVTRPPLPVPPVEPTW